MRALVLSIVASVLLVPVAHAQVSIPDPFLVQGPVSLPDPDEISREHSPLYSVRFRPEQDSRLRTDRGVSIPLGSVRLVGEGSSYYPGGTSNLKVRNESLHLAWPLSHRTDLVVGAWRFKQRQEGLEQMRMLTIGAGFVRRF